MRSFLLFVCLLSGGCSTFRVQPTAYAPTQWDVENLFRDVRQWSYAITACRTELPPMEQMALRQLFLPVQEAAWNLEMAWNRGLDATSPARRLADALEDFKMWTLTPDYGVCRLHLNEENF